jgi:hypothetical protein
MFLLILSLGLKTLIFPFVAQFAIHYSILPKRGKGGMMVTIIIVMTIIITITITITITIIILTTIITITIIFLGKKDYNYTSIYHSLNAEGKVRWGILRKLINKYELEDLGYCWIILQNVNENTSAAPDILFREHN